MVCLADLRIVLAALEDQLAVIEEVHDRHVDEAGAYRFCLQGNDPYIQIIKRGYPDNSAREYGLPPSPSVTPPSEREALAKLVRLFIIANGPLFEGAVTK